MFCASSCLRINNPLRNLILPSIIFVAIDKLFGYIFYVSLFKNVWTPYQYLWRPMEQVNYWCFGMAITSLAYALVINLLYVKICNLAKKEICLGGFALIVFLLGRFFGEIYGYLMYPYDLRVVLLGMGHGFFVLFVWAFICKKIFVIKIQN